MEQTQRQVNWAYLLPLVCTLTMGCAVVGFVIAGNNQVGGILSVQFDWQDKETAWNTGIASAGVSGLIIGSFAIEPVTKAIGRRKSIMTTSLLCSLAVIPTVFLNEGLILFGKFLLGLGAGGLIVSSSLYLNETAPAECGSTLGFTTNFGVIVGVMTCLLMGAALPDPVENPAAAATNKFWMVISLFPALIGLINLALWVFVYRLESLKLSIAADPTTPLHEQALVHVGKIYKTDQGESAQEIYESLYEANREAKLNQADVPSFCEVLKEPKYRKATWLVIAIAFFNQMTGVNLISIYSTTLFQQMSESATGSSGISISPGTGSALVGVSQFLGCLIAPLFGRCLGMKPIFVGGQIFMGVFELLVAIFSPTDYSFVTTMFILLFLFAYQATQGSFFWFYVAAVATDTGNSIASIVLWAIVLLMSTCSRLVLDGLGQAATFYLFATICFLGALLFIFSMKEIKGLTKEQQQSLYNNTAYANEDSRNKSEENSVA